MPKKECKIQKNTQKKFQEPTELKKFSGLPLQLFLESFQILDLTGFF
jgi:hypothetical protein